MFGHVTQIFGVKAASGRRSDTIPELISNRSRERFLEDDESQRGAHSIFVFFQRQHGKLTPDQPASGVLSHACQSAASTDAETVNCNDICSLSFPSTQS